MPTIFDTPMLLNPLDEFSSVQFQITDITDGLMEWLVQSGQMFQSWSTDNAGVTSSHDYFSLGKSNQPALPFWERGLGGEGVGG